MIEIVHCRSNHLKCDNCPEDAVVDIYVGDIPGEGRIKVCHKCLLKLHEDIAYEVS